MNSDNTDEVTAAMERMHRTQWVPVVAPLYVGTGFFDTAEAVVAGGDEQKLLGLISDCEGCDDMYFSARRVFAIGVE